MTLCLPLEMSLSKELLWAYSLSSKTTLMTGNGNGAGGLGGAHLSVRQTFLGRKGLQISVAPSAMIAQWTDVCAMCLWSPSLHQ